MFYTGELEKEIRDPNAAHRITWTFAYNSDREEYIKRIVDEQSDCVYPHKQSTSCPKAGNHLVANYYQKACMNLNNH